MTEERLIKIAEESGTNVATAREYLLEYDWTQDGVTKPGEHEKWVEEASDEELVNWLWNATR